MILTYPMIISSRLLPAVKIGDATISLDYLGERAGRGVVCIYIDRPGNPEYVDDGLRIASTAGESDADYYRKAMKVCLAFLDNDADRYRGSGNMGTTEPVDPYSFSADLAEWAYVNQTEIQSVEIDLDPEGEY